MAQPFPDIGLIMVRTWPAVACGTAPILCEIDVHQINLPLRATGGLTSGVHVGWSDSGGAAIFPRLPNSHPLESVMSASKCLCLPGGQSTDGRSMGSTKVQQQHGVD